MDETPTAVGKTRCAKPQVMIVEKFWQDKDQIRQEYQEALPGTEVMITTHFGFLEDYARRTHIDFVVISVDLEAGPKTVRKQISAIWQVCSETKIILMARAGFNANDARVKAVVPKGSLPWLAKAIRELR